MSSKNIQVFHLWVMQCILCIAACSNNTLHLDQENKIFGQMLFPLCVMHCVAASSNRSNVPCGSRTVRPSLRPLRGEGDTCQVSPYLQIPPPPKPPVTFSHAFPIRKSSDNGTFTVKSLNFRTYDYYLMVFWVDEWTR